ncbi:MAG: hypothetical protein E6J39_07605 [Chloroflexi bacterium]|nr:MAG: hypothetical protein E6J39_07605 [Chloroflexota bacterium]
MTTRAAIGLRARAHLALLALPALPMSAIAVTAFFALVALPRATMPLVDGDVWWHLRAGEMVLATGQVPKVDTWTLVGDGMRWISQDWLSNTLMAALLAAGGALGETLLSLVFGALVVLAFALLWRSVGVRAPASGWLGRFVWLTVGLLVAGPVVGVRVQTVDLVMVSLTIWSLWHFVTDRRRAWPLLLPVLAVGWVNLHAGFPLLFAFGGAVLVGEAGDRLLRRRVTPEPLAWRDLGWLAGGLVAAAVALVLNPNGIDIYAYPFATAGIQAHRDFIFEWSRPDLSSLPGQLLFGLLALAVVPTLLLARRELRLTDALWLLGATALSLSAIRFLLVIGPVAAVMACVYLAPRLAATPFGRASRGLTQRLGRPARTSGLAAVNLVLCLAVALLGAGVALARVTPSAQSSAIAEAMPVAATAWLRDHAPRARIFNVYSWGGWLGRELPRARVYIDGRSDIYGDAPIRTYAQAIDLETDPAQLLDRYRIDHVVFWPDSALTGWLDRSPAWRRVYTDGQAAVWERTRTPVD